MNEAVSSEAVIDFCNINKNYFCLHGKRRFLDYMQESKIW